MARRRNDWSLGTLCCLLCAVVAFGACGQNQPREPSELSHSASADPQFAVVFPQDRALRLDVDVFSDALPAEPFDDAAVLVVPGRVRFDGYLWEDVEVEIPRHRWIAWHQTGEPYPLRLAFSSPQRPDQRFYGFAHLELHPAPDENALGSTHVTLDVLREAGIPTPHTVLSMVTLRTGNALPFQAIYTVAEMPGPPMLDSQYDEDDGALYVVDGESATFSIWDPDAIVQLQSADESWDAPNPVALFDLLKADPRDALAWRFELEQVFDVYEFLRLLAARAALGSTEGYGRTPTSVLLYWDPGDKRYHWIPAIRQGALEAKGSGPDPLAADLSNVESEWLLIRRLMDDPAYSSTYLAYLEETLRGVLDVPRLQRKLSDALASILPLLSEADSDVHSMLPAEQDIAEALDRVLLSVEERYAETEDAIWKRGLRPSPIVISELHYNPSLDQGIDNNFEFIELFNRGSRTVDLSGYRFVEGLEFALPPGTILRPAQCLLISKRAETYRDAPCEVQQWSRGSLSNGGEVVRLLDRAGTEVDSVKYDDVAPWPEAADAGGSSLEITDPGLPNYTFHNWQASAQIGGSPGWIGPQEGKDNDG